MKVVAIGGGHGLTATLRAARSYADEVAAVVTVADDGGSSGQLTRELGIPPPGDLRNCIVALGDDALLSELYQHRFESGALTGHTLGNLLIAALTEMTGDFARAVAEAGLLIHCAGRVYPATTSLVNLGARVDGGIVRGQVAVAQTTRRIHEVYLEPSDPPAYAPAVDVIADADQVVLGPGSLFTSLIATVIVPGIRSALQRTSARRVLVCNTRMQKGETEGLDAADHVRAFMAQAGAGSIDAVVVQSPVLVADGIAVRRPALSDFGVEVVEEDVAGPDGLHDPGRLAAVLRRLA